MEKINKKRLLASMLTLVMAFSTLVNSGSTAMAATEDSISDVQSSGDIKQEAVETEEINTASENQGALPYYDEIKDKLGDDERVIVEDVELSAGEVFDISGDFKNLTFDKQKVKVSLKEVMDSNQQPGFDYNKAGTYQAVYKCEPISGKNAYLVKRQIIVKEREAETKESKQSNHTKDSTESDDADADGDADPGAKTVEDTKDVEKVIDDGFLFTMIPTQELYQRSSKSSLEVGKLVRYPASLGNYVTNYYYVDGHLAYCLESMKGTPSSGDYIEKVLKSNKDLQKVLYYGFGGPGDITDKYMPGYDDDTKFVFTHIAASYEYCGADGFYGCTKEDLKAAGVLDYIEYLENMKEPPSATISLSSTKLTPSFNGKIQTTTKTKLKGDERNYITLTIPDKVTYHNETDNKTKTGGSVKIYGGTTFYFTAPKTMKGNWSTGNMKGKIGSQWQALALETGDTQDIGYGKYTEKAEPVSFSVKWLDIASIALTKKDDKTNKPLAGAVFGIYSDSACKNLITKMPATDASGKSNIDLIKTQDTVYLKEITAPSGYRINTKSYNVALVAAKTTSVAVTNEEQKGKIVIHKKGEALKAVWDGNPLKIEYENIGFAGANYEIYAAEDIFSQDKVTKIHNKGDLIQKLTTDAQGNTISNELFLGKYKVVETKAPSDLTIGKTEQERTHEVTLSYKGQSVELSESQTDYKNERPKIDLYAEKKSATEKNVTLQGATFQLCAGENIKNYMGEVVLEKDKVIETVVSGQDGKASFTADIPIGHTYYIKESLAPEKYYKSDEIFTFQYTYKDDKTYVYEHHGEFSNEEVRGTVHVNKIDKETDAYQSQGDAILDGAVYGLYAKNDIVHPNKKTGVVYKAGELVDQKVIKDGKADFTDLYLGEYYVQEIEPPEGYLLDSTKYPVSVPYEGQEVKVVERNVTVKEQVKKQAFQLIKISEDGDQTEVDLVEGAGFRIYLLKDISGVKDGTMKPSNGADFVAKDFAGYDFSKEKPAVLYQNGKKIEIPEMFTDKKGYVQSPEIPYGKYVVVETTTPENLDTIAPFIVNVTDDNREPQVWRVFDDRPFEFLLKIIKKDSVTAKPVLNNSASYKIYNLDTKKYVEQIVHYPKFEKISIFKTNEDGYLITPEELKSGNYRIEEVKAPENYVKPGYEERLYSDGKEILFPNTSLNGEYKATPGKAIEVHLDSKTAHQVEPDTNKKIIMVEQYNDQAIGSMNLKKEGQHLTGVESESIVHKVQNGLANAAKKLSNFFTGEDEVAIGNKNLKFEYADGGVENAEFQVYAKEAIYTADGQMDEEGNRLVQYKKDQLIATLKTDAEGKAQLSNLPVGKYYVKETVAGNSFVLNKEVKEFEIKYDGDETAVTYSNVEYYNQRQKIKINIIKKDTETKLPVPDTVFGLYAEEEIRDIKGNVIVEKDTLIEKNFTDKDGKLLFEADLPHGKYYLKELAPHPGYLPSNEVYHFDATYQDQEINEIELTKEITNQPTVTKLKKTDIVTGEEVPGAKLQIIDEDGKVVEEWISSKEPHFVYALSPGKYLLRETLAPKGYVRAQDVKFTVEATGKVKSVEMKDERAKGRLKIHKIDDESKKGLEGAIFELRDKETGKVLEELKTGKDGKAESRLLDIGTFTDGKLDKAHTYILVEKQAPEDYINNDKPMEITFKYKDDTTPVIEINKEIANKKVKEIISSTPKTGDSTPIFMLIGLGVSAIIAIIYCIMKKRKKK